MGYSQLSLSSQLVRLSWSVVRVRVSVRIRVRVLGLGLWIRI